MPAGLFYHEMVTGTLKGVRLASRDVKYDVNSQWK